MTNSRMTINQAAKWAARKQAYGLYAVVDTADNTVHCLGSFDKCLNHMSTQGVKGYYGQSADGRWLRRYSIDEVMEQIDEEQGEENCIPEPGWIAEWA